MKFSDITGHDEVKARLREMVDTHRMPHALLLEGPEGTGKLALARALAQYIHCTDRTPDGEPCGKCPACLQHQTFNQIDTTYVFPVVRIDGMTQAPTSYDFMDQWREYLAKNHYVSAQSWAACFTKKNARPLTYVTQSSELIRRMALTSSVSDYKIVLWWLPELMNQEAANKLLKLIEEPFADTIFIMVSDTPSDILPTIYSRLQRIPMLRLPDSVIADELVRKHGIDPQQAASLAHVADGSMVAAKSLVEGAKIRQENLDRFKELMRLAYQRKVADLRKWANDLADTGREREILFYKYAVRMMRENFVYNLKVPQITYLADDEQQFSANFARFITAANVEMLIKVFDRAIRDIAANGNGKIVNFDVAVKVIMLLKQ